MAHGARLPLRLRLPQERPDALLDSRGASQGQGLPPARSFPQCCHPAPQRRNGPALLHACLDVDAPAPAARQPRLLRHPVRHAPDVLPRRLHGWRARRRLPRRPHRPQAHHHHRTDPRNLPDGLLLPASWHGAAVAHRTLPHRGPAARAAAEFSRLGTARHARQ